MLPSSAAEPGTAGRPSEDWHYTDQHVAIIIDGATVRTDTGCIHGVPWYVQHLGKALVERVQERPREPAAALRHAIEHVRTLHPQCDLAHPGTPSAGVGIVVDTGQALLWLVLGDVTIAVDDGDEIDVITDDRIGQTAQSMRLQADQYPIDSPEKTRALQAMKAEELAARNTATGYWIAAADPYAVNHALLGVRSHPWKQLALLTDGAARAHTFGLLSWPEIFAVLDTAGPKELIGVVRDAENADAIGDRWPRNKKSDDASVIYARPDEPSPLQLGDQVVSQWDTHLAGEVIEIFGNSQANLLVQWATSPVPVQMPAAELYKADVERSPSAASVPSAGVESS